MDDVADRFPPQNLDAEQAFLGACLLDKDAPIYAAELLTGKDFYTQQNRYLYETIKEMAAEGKAVDLVTLEAELAARGRLEAVGGAQYLRALLAATPSAANQDYYANIIREASVRRSFIKRGTGVVQDAYALTTPLEEISIKIERQMIEAAIEAREKDGLRIDRGVMMEIAQQLDRDEIPKGLDTGFVDYDAYIRGLQPSTINIIAARPTVGKSTFVMNIGMHVAKNGGKVGWILMEGTKIDLGRRMTSCIAQQPFFPETGKERTPEHGVALFAAAEEVNKLMSEFIYIDDGYRQTPIGIITKARAMKQQHGLDLLIVDYLQLIEGAREGMITKDRVTAASRGLKHLAKDLEIPVMAVAMISREALKDRKRGKILPPQIHHLKDSGDIEQDADTILMLHTEENENEERADDDFGSMPASLGERSVDLKCYLRKHKEGRTGSFHLRYFYSQFRMENSYFGNGEGF